MFLISEYTQRDPKCNQGSLHMLGLTQARLTQRYPYQTEREREEREREGMRVDEDANAQRRQQHDAMEPKRGGVAGSEWAGLASAGNKFGTYRKM